MDIAYRNDCHPCGTLACGSRDAPSVAPTAEWHDFHGTWTAAGNRHSLRLGSDRRASITDFNGSLVLAGTTRPAVGFGAEAIVLSDTATGMVGRTVWTDERGDQVYSELKGEGTASRATRSPRLSGSPSFSGSVVSSTNWGSWATWASGSPGGKPEHHVCSEQLPQAARALPAGADHDSVLPGRFLVDRITLDTSGHCLTGSPFCAANWAVRSVYS